MDKPAAVALVAAALACGPATAGPGTDEDFAGQWERNGRLSRHLWTPDFASGQTGGVQVSAGLAIGLRGPVRDHVGRRIAPALTLQWSQAARVSMLPAGGGAMLVLQLQP